MCRPMKGIKTFVSYYIYSDFKFTEFNDDGVDQLGHFIQSIPEHHFTVILDAYSQSKWFARGEIEYGSAFFVNNENTIKNDAYTQASSRLGGKALWEYFGGLFFFGLKNIFDSKYQTNTRINASSSRFFEPGPPLNAYGGMSLVYHY